MKATKSTKRLSLRSEKVERERANVNVHVFKTLMSLLGHNYCIYSYRELLNVRMYLSYRQLIIYT